MQAETDIFPAKSTANDIAGLRCAPVVLPKAYMSATTIAALAVGTQIPLGQQAIANVKRNVATSSERQDVSKHFKGDCSGGGGLIGCTGIPVGSRVTGILVIVDGMLVVLVCGTNVVAPYGVKGLLLRERETSDL
jgi:hypothetical protein